MPFTPLYSRMCPPGSSYLGFILSPHTISAQHVTDSLKLQMDHRRWVQ